MTRAPSAADLDAVSAQLGRPARDVLAIAARTTDGAPAVVATAPRLADGTPFPTFYYLTHPALVAAVSRLEADGVMRPWSELVAEGGPLAEAYAAAHRAYLADRAAAGDVPEVAGTSAGGMPVRVKCLHALAGHALAAGPGVNPIGDLALSTAAEAEPEVARLVGRWPAPAPLPAPAGD
ncbi:DUF501 domain-containing protein [Amnibacterium endophyticum]|uniref:DUF501 domain-containing protein n=1 Tax=Amnibacterium endophyticum TaxID=2109337 RepID=A0ABW4LBJ1_9MICO